MEISVKALDEVIHAASRPESPAEEIRYIANPVEISRTPKRQFVRPTSRNTKWKSRTG